jgi:hypothetical protein
MLGLPHEAEHITFPNGMDDVEEPVVGRESAHKPWILDHDRKQIERSFEN